MTKWISLSVLAVSAALLTGCTRSQALFDGRDLNGWRPYLADPAVTPDAVWSVNDGILRCEGKPNGYIRTERQFSDYRLHVEWRWPEKPANSGVLLHAVGPDKLWPICVEAQLAADNAGDFIAVGQGTRITVHGIEHQPAPDKTSQRVRKAQPSSEKPAGQWNSYDIYCQGNTIRLYVNGVLQNTAVDTSLTGGSICLQSEGGPIEFRNITIESF
ncbi:MAG: DUF1080 domain-containing protein [Planctomycetaceae bacterium]|nr:DUF1080 domain-containing protein [Planctomycetaceae bacterium]